MAEGSSAGAATAASAGPRTASPSHLQGQDRTGQGGTGCSWTKEDKLGRGGGTPTADAVGQVGELLGVVQHLHALGVGVVAHREGLGDGGSELPDGDRRKNVNHPLTPPPPSPRRPHRGPAPQPTSLSLWHCRSCRQRSRRAGTP